MKCDNCGQEIPERAMKFGHMENIEARDLSEGDIAVEYLQVWCEKCERDYWQPYLDAHEKAGRKLAELRRLDSEAGEGAP